MTELTPKITFRLLGKDWEWRYTLRTIFEFDKLASKTFFLLRLSDLTSEDWVKLVYAGIKQQDPGLTWDNFVGDTTNVLEMQIAVARVMDLLLSSVVKKNEDADSDPTSPPSTG